jgi:hypothetical protein
MVTDAVTRLFARRSSMVGEGVPGADKKDAAGLGIRVVDDSEGASWDLRSSRQLPGPPRGARRFS